MSVVAYKCKNCGGELLFDPDTQNVNTWLCDMILGAKDMLDGNAETLAGFKVIDDYNFEISPDGRPYWIVSTYVKTIGFSGEDATGVVTLDAQTGQTKHYDIASTPQWIDRIQPDDFVLQQITYWGKYIKGWTNAKINDHDDTERDIADSVVA